MSVSLTPLEYELLRAARRLCAASAHGIKSAAVLRAAIDAIGPWDQPWDPTLCNSGDAHPQVAEAYRAMKSLIDSGLLLGAGDWEPPAGPRYTECEITAAGVAALQQYEQSTQ